MQIHSNLALRWTVFKQPFSHKMVNKLGIFWSSLFIHPSLDVVFVLCCDYNHLIIIPTFRS